MNLVNLIKNKLLASLGSLLTEQQESVCIKNMKILLEGQGFLHSLRVNKCVDNVGRPIPWYTYPAIEYISQFDLKGKCIFEYGSGNSSLYWAERANMVMSVENNQEWYEEILKKAPKNLKLAFKDDKDEYVNHIDSHSSNFDVIIIDGAYRFDAAMKALSRISENGLIILDNSDRAVAFEDYAKATRLMRDTGLIQVDMAGFGPLNNYTWTTSFFFTKNFNFVTVDDIQPHKPVGGNVLPRQFGS